jgi:hypothetical protein
MSMDDTLRASDRDRDQVAETLREHYAQGRLTMEEFDERSTAATRAKTLGDLRELTTDLPVRAEPQETKRAWSTAQMWWIGIAGVVATAVILGLATYAGHWRSIVPGWLVILVVVRLLHGRRRYPTERTRPPTQD